MTTPNNDPDSTGTITFYYPDGKMQCSFDIVTRSQYFWDTGCKRLEIGSSFALNKAPSTARIWLYEVWSEKYEYGNWTEILVIKETTSTEKIVIADLATLQRGTVVRPGARFIERHVGAPSIPLQNVFRMRIEFVP